MAELLPVTNAEFVASQLGEVGINVTIETVEFSVWLEQVFTNDDYDMTAVLHVEPRDIGNYANPDYYWQYDSPEVQQLIADAKASPTRRRRPSCSRQAARQISEDSPVDWLAPGRRPHRVAHRRHRLPDRRHRLPVRRLGDHTGRMTWFVLRRLALLVLAIFVTSIVVFLLLRLLPGDLARVVGGTEASPEQIEAIREELGLNRSLVAQYLDWIGGIFHGDFGMSALNGETVTSELGEKLSVSAPLVLASTVLSVVVAVPLGIVAGARHRRADGVALSAVSQLGIALPSFWVGLMLIIVFAVNWQLFPAQGFPLDGWDDPARGDRRRSCCRRSRWRWPRAPCCCGSCARRRSTCCTRTTSARRGPRA